MLDDVLHNRLLYNKRLSAKELMRKQACYFGSRRRMCASECTSVPENVLFPLRKDLYVKWNAEKYICRTLSCCLCDAVHSV